MKTMGHTKNLAQCNWSKVATIERILRSRGKENLIKCEYVTAFPTGQNPMLTVKHFGTSDQFSIDKYVAAEAANDVW